MRKLLIPLVCIGLLFACSDDKPTAKDDKDSTNKNGSATTNNALKNAQEGNTTGKTAQQPVKKLGPVAHFVLHVEGWSCPRMCPKRIQATLASLDGTIGSKAIYSKKEVKVQVMRAKLDLAKIEKALRENGYRCSVKQHDGWTKAQLDNHYVPPKGKKIVLEIAGWSKTKGCTPTGPPPQKLVKAIKKFGPEWTELNFINDTLICYFEGNGPRVADVIAAVQGTGARANTPGDKGEIPDLVQRKLLDAKAQNKRRVVIEFTSPT